MGARTLAQWHGRLVDFISPAVSGMIALYILIPIPGTVVSSDDGLEAVFWFRKNKRIRWHDIEQIETDRESKLFSIVATPEWMAPGSFTRGCCPTSLD
jgi:hypothetical protein